MKTKKKQIPKEKKLFSNKRLPILVLSLVVVIVSGFLLFRFLVQTPEVEFSFKAAIIDQIGETFPSSSESAREFNETVTNLLENAGFNVSYHENNSITVDFYKGLAKYDYGIIILRGHSAQRRENEKIIVDFFTSEKWSEDEYAPEQRDGLLSRGNYTWESGKFYFAVTPKFIEHLEGSFPKSVVIAMGCWSLKPDSEEMADAFINKGAKAYIGWTGLVQPSHTDNETIRLLRQFLAKNKTLSDAVDTLERDPLYGSRMEYHPLEAGNLTISNLIAEEKGSTNHLSAITLFEPILTVYLCEVTPKIRRVSNLAYVKLTC